MNKRKLQSLANFTSDTSGQLRDIWTLYDKLFWKLDKRYSLKKSDPDPQSQEESKLLLNIITLIGKPRSATKTATEKEEKINDELWDELDQM
jgi:benzoyl-CoA reductase/2-hydroxyglutaryl-CoA dehydratase subunit BcrC/BadD/HgdB